MSIDSHRCPHYGGECDRDEVHNGVALIHGPWGCGACGWSEYPEYDNRAGIVKDGNDRVLDQYGVSHHVDRIDGMAVVAGLHRQLKL